jgi:hypothetical protein
VAYLDSADLIRRMKVKLNRPSTDAAFTVTSTDDALYDALSEAQDSVTKLIATFIPDCMISAPTALSTADSGATYTFGTDADSAAKFALGFFSVYETRADIPDNPMEPNIDFVIEGTKLRILNNLTRTFADSGPWAQTVSASNVISSATQPTVPVICRMTLLEKACEIAADRLGLDSSKFASNAGERWMEVLAAVRTQAKGKYGATLLNRPRSYFMRRGLW